MSNIRTCLGNIKVPQRSNKRSTYSLRSPSDAHFEVLVLFHLDYIPKITAIMMHPSRQAYVEEDEPEVRTDSEQLCLREYSFNVLQSDGSSSSQILAVSDRWDHG